MSDSSSSVTSSLFSGTGIRSSGLMSGLDTETIVKQMASGTKAMINTKKQKLDSLSWKQESYRGLITKFSDFKDKYLNSLNQSTNIMSNYLMGSYTAKSSNSSVTATASTNAAATSYSITKIQQLAKKASVTANYGTGTLTNGIALDFSKAEAGKTYTVSVALDGLAKDITFTGGSDKSKTSANLKTALDLVFTDKKFVVEDGNLKYTANDGISHSYTVSYAKKAYDSGSSEDAINKSQALAALGITADIASNKISLGTKLDDANFATELSGGTYSFSVNGKNYTFTGQNTINDVMSAVNADGTAKLKFNSLAQSFSFESADDGASSELSIKQESGNLLNALLGQNTIGTGNVGSLSLKKSGIISDEITNTSFNSHKNAQFEVTVNGVKKTIGLWGYNSSGIKVDYDDDSDKGVKGSDNVIEQLNKQMTREFGSSAPQFSYGDSDKNSFVLKGANALDTVSLNAISGDTDSTSLVRQMGFDIDKTTTNEITDETNVYSLLGKTGTFKIGDNEITISTSTTFASLKEDLGKDGSVNMETGSIIAYGTISADDSNKAFVSALFNSDYNDLNSYTATGTSTLNMTGQNAIATINGVTVSNATNSFTIDGTTINVGGLSEKEAGEISETNSINVTTSRDTTKAFDAVVKFINDYNTLITDSYAEINTKRPKSSSGDRYDPLTEEQKDKMSDDEIKKWEAQAKTGLLYADSTTSELLGRVRSAMDAYTSEGFSLYDMGITVSTTYSDHGKLIIDEAKLKNAFDQHPDQVQKLFTDSENGLGVRVKDAVDSGISTSGTTGYGTLVRMAGVANTTSANENSITTQLNAYQDIIDSLQKRYDSEISRYWSQFTALETAMAKFNSQASLFQTNQ